MATYFSAAITMKKRGQRSRVKYATHKCGAHNFPDKICLFIQSHTKKRTCECKFESGFEVGWSCFTQNNTLRFNPTGKFRKSFGQACNRRCDFVRIPTGFYFPLSNVGSFRKQHIFLEARKNCINYHFYVSFAVSVSLRSISFFSCQLFRAVRL